MADNFNAENLPPGDPYTWTKEQIDNLISNTESRAGASDSSIIMNYYAQYLKQALTNPVYDKLSLEQFMTKVGDLRNGTGFANLINEQSANQKVADTKTNEKNNLKTEFTGNVDTAVTNGYLTADQATQLKGMWDSGLNDQAKANLTTWVNDFVTKQNNPETPTSAEDITTTNAANLKTKFGESVATALEGGYITEDQATQLTDLYDINPDNANLNLNTWVNSSISKTNEPAVPKFEYKEPDYVTEAKRIIQEEMAIDPQFNPDTVNSWLPTLQKAQEGAKATDLESNTATMNSLGRLFSGQTLQNSQNINNNYTMDALNKALGFASEEYASQKATKNAAVEKNLAMGQYETGIAQYQNQQDVDEAIRQLTETLGTINTNKSTNYNDITNAIARMYGEEDTASGINWSTITGENQVNTSDLETMLDRIYANEDWTKNANLTSWLNSLNKDTEFDWTKLLPAAATVTAAAI